MSIIKVPRIKIGDTIAIISPSWGGPSVYPDVYENGIKYIQSLGFKTKEYPSARADAKFLHDNPEFRAEDLNKAFADPDVKGIIATIGGDDCVRLLPYLDKEIAIKNPKMLMGYSDTTILTTFYNFNGMVTFNGPSVMAGFSQAKNLGEQYQLHLKEFMLGNVDFNNYIYPKFSFYSEGYPDFSKLENIGKTKETKETDEYHWLQGKGSVEEKQLLDEMIIDVVKNEFGNSDLTIVTNMDFGHTDPQIILPLGVNAKLDNSKKEFCLLESPFQEK